MIRRLAKLVFLAAAPLVLSVLALVFFLQDCITWLIKNSRLPNRNRTQSRPARNSFTPPSSASIVIPNWNGKDLLEKFLPFAIAECRSSDELIVVDNASQDGSAEFVKQNFPQVRVLEMPRNLGFGGGCNAGVQVARNPVVILLNNDMRVTAGFIQALLDGFTCPEVFAVSAQIFFSDPSRRREETGLTTGHFSKGFFRVGHDTDERVETIYPAMYAGGGSSAYDRQKYLELGGFDTLFEPFYLEDTDLSYNAWRRGWFVLYQPRAKVFHEHRGTIGKHFSPQAIQAYLQKNYVLMVWKNMHQTDWLLSHWIYLYAQMLLHSLGGETQTRTAIGSFLLALRQLPQALRTRHRAKLRAQASDAEVFQRLRPSVFREAFPSIRQNRGESAPPIEHSLPQISRQPLNILFVSPYSIFPAVHGGAVFMLQAIQKLAERHNVYVLTFVDSPNEVESNRELERWVRKLEVVVRKHRPTPLFHWNSHAQQVFHDPAFAALLDRMVYVHDIDLIQFEYTQLAQYRIPLRTVPQCLFEHDIYFRSVGRQLTTTQGTLLAKSAELLEWLRGLRFELEAAEQFDAVFTCHEQEQRVLQSFLENGHPWVLPDLRTAIEVRSYPFPGGPRQPDSLLFVGNFQHLPNREGLEYFCREVFPLIRAMRPHATLSVVGAGMDEATAGRFSGEGIRLLGRVPDIREPLSTHAVFVCPIRTGAGVRVKILEAFSSGIPVVSTTIGAEGLAATSGNELLLADHPAAFANACVSLLSDITHARSIATNARRLVESHYDWDVVIENLDTVYRELVRQSRASRAGKRFSAPVEDHADLIAR